MCPPPRPLANRIRMDTLTPAQRVSFRRRPAPNSPVCDHASHIPCFAALLALIGPRVALVGVAIFSNLISRAFDSLLVPLIGFLILPWTTLAYTIMWDVGTHQVVGFEWFIVIIGFLADVGALAGGR